jgi:23S rRNA pseudouridine2605 synthase
MQLNKYLALCGIASRRKASLPILQGRVIVNDDCVRELGRVVDPQKDRIFLDGHRLECPEKYRYILMNKPAGVITAVVDDRKRKTVVDLIASDVRVFPVGRLDYDTEGVLLLTNDGELAYRLAHPKFEIDKVYHAWVEGHVQKDTLQKLRQGVFIDKGVKVSGEVIVLERKANQTRVEIRIHQGKKRQVKRMMKSVGHAVLHLERIRFAGLEVNGLDKGQWRELTAKEVDTLYRITGLKGKSYASRSGTLR